MIRFTHLSAKDTFSYKHLEFDFKSGLSSIEGRNGSSKTSIFMTLAQALFNRNPKGCKVEEVNNFVTGKPYEIDVTFIKDKDTYRVINSRKQGTITLLKNGNDISLKRIPENLALIAEILGTDFTTFSDLVYQSKDSTLNILETSTDKGRKEFVARVLKLEEIDAQLSRMKDKEKELAGKNGKLATLTDRIRLAEASLAPLVDAGLEVEAPDPDFYKEKMANVLKKLNPLNTQIALIQRDIVAAQDAQLVVEKREKLQSRLDQLERPTKSRDELDKEAARLHSSAAKLKEQMVALKTDLDKMVQAQEKGKCYACGGGIEKGQFDSEIAEKKLQGNQLKEQHKAEVEALAINSATRQQWSEVEKVEQELLKLSGIKTPKVDLEALQIKLAALLGERSILTADKDTCTRMLEAAEQASTHNTMVRAKRQANEAIARNNDKIQLQIDQDKKTLEELETKLGLVKAWQGILGSKGYRVARIKKFIASLNHLMTKYTQMISEGRIKCNFYITDSGEIAFTITDDAKEMPYELWSGGEKARVKLVCLFAVLELLESMGSISFNVLALDEIFSALDAEGKEGLFQVLTYLKDHGKAIYTIAHEELTLDLHYDYKVVAVKLPDGTSEIVTK